VKRAASIRHGPKRAWLRSEALRMFTVLFGSRASWCELLTIILSEWVGSWQYHTDFYAASVDEKSL